MNTLFQDAGVMVVLITLIAYFIPSFIASLRKHNRKGLVFFSNLLFGLSGIGWIIVLLWAMMGSNVEITSKHKDRKKITPLGWVLVAAVSITIITLMTV